MRNLMTCGRGCWWAAALTILLTAAPVSAQENPFAPEFPYLESEASGRWWETVKRKPQGRPTPPRLLVPRADVIGFAVYTHDRGVLKLTAQLHPLKPEEAREVHLELQREGQWQRVQTQPVHELGWSAHFRIDDWDNTQSVDYRLRHGDAASFEGRIRRDPVDKEVIVVGALSCNSSRTPGPRPQMLENLKQQDPDLLFFAGDQSYHHTEHTFGWLEFGLQFRDVLRDRPVITIPDDHDIGQANLWGEGGIKAQTHAGPSGGYYYPAEYVNMVERCQTGHLPDPYEPAPVKRGIGVYYTSLRVGGIDFAILEDRKFKSGPEGKIPKMGPRPDHINDPSYDRDSIDVEGLELLGERQLEFLHAWGQDWSGAEMKCVLSQTAFCGAVHLHGTPDNRLLADLDCNGWPQSGRNKALREIRRAWAPHVCGDQHLAVLVKHGIDAPSDGPFGFTTPAIVNTIYGRWWHPKDEQAGADPVPGSPLEWTGEYQDGLGNLIRMLAYANPTDRTDETQRADGHGIVRFNKTTRQITFECWPRFSRVQDGDAAQFPGWPVTIAVQDNDGRQPVGWLPTLVVSGSEAPVVQVIEEASGEILYTTRSRNNRVRLPVYAAGSYTVRIGKDRPHDPGAQVLSGLQAGAKDNEQPVEVTLSGAP